MSVYDVTVNFKVKNLAMFNREVILPRAVEVTNLVIAHCNNIRSKISGAAIETLKELYRFLKKALIQNLEFSVKVFLVLCVNRSSKLYSILDTVSSRYPFLDLTNNIKVTNGWSWKRKRISARKMRKMFCRNNWCHDFYKESLTHRA